MEQKNPRRNVFTSTLNAYFDFDVVAERPDEGGGWQFETSGKGTKKAQKALALVGAKDQLLAMSFKGSDAMGSDSQRRLHQISELVERRSGGTAANLAVVKIPRVPDQLQAGR